MPSLPRASSSTPLESFSLPSAPPRVRRGAPRLAAAALTASTLSCLLLTAPACAQDIPTPLEVLRTTTTALDRASAHVVPPSVAALHADLKFSVTTPARAAAGDDAAPAGLLTRQAQRLVPALEAAARGLHPGMMARIGNFDVYVAESNDVETRSSSTGKVALHAGLAPLQLTDDALAFVIAREMGHVLAGHQEDNSTASLVTSVVMNLLLPGSGLLKSALSMATSEAVSAAGGERQVREADEIAVRLLETAGYHMRDLRLSLALDASEERMGDGSWAKSFRTSVTAILANARPVVQAAAVASLTGVTLAAGDVPDATIVDTPGASAAAVTAAAPTARTGNVAASAAGTPSAAVPAPLVNAIAPAPALPLSLEPVMRGRPSGVAGPFMLGGYSVPSRRID